MALAKCSVGMNGLYRYGRVVSTRILRDPSHQSRGVGFARMESKEVCDKVIEVLHGKIMNGNFHYFYVIYRLQINNSEFVP